jgi:hypothetical protein
VRNHATTPSRQEARTSRHFSSQLIDAFALLIRQCGIRYLRQSQPFIRHSRRRAKKTTETIDAALKDNATAIKTLDTIRESIERPSRRPGGAHSGIRSTVERDWPQHVGDCSTILLREKTVSSKGRLG